MRILIVASDRMEFAGLVKRSDRSVPLGLPVDYACRTYLGAQEVVLAANGIGEARAAAAVDAAAQGFAPDAIVSVGFCGALAPDLCVADIVVGAHILASGRSFAARTPETETAYRTGAICSIDHVARTAEEKRQLHAAGAIAVEMEAAGVASRAEALGVPFYCIKTVTDLAEETLENDFNEALRSDGHFDTMKILKSSLRNPSVRLRELVRLRKRCMRAAIKLGDFVADCRF